MWDCQLKHYHMIWSTLMPLQVVSHITTYKSLYPQMTNDRGCIYESARQTTDLNLQGLQVNKHN